MSSSSRATMTSQCGGRRPGTLRGGSRFSIAGRIISELGKTRIVPKSHDRRIARPVYRAPAPPRGAAPPHGPLRRARAPARRDAPGRARGHRGAPVASARHRVDAALAGRPRLRARLRLLRFPRDRAPDRLPHPLAEHRARDAGGPPHLLALPELPRLPLGASPLHAGRGARSRALLREARVGRRLSARADRGAEPDPARERSSAAREWSGRPAVDGRAGASAADPGGAYLPGCLPRGRPRLRADRLADGAAPLDRAAAGRAGIPPPVSPGRAHRLWIHPRLP